MENNRKIFVWMILGLSVIAALSGGWYYFGVVRKAGPAEDVLLTVPFGTVVPQTISFQPILAEGWSYSGIIQKIDFQNKFFILKMIPLYPVSLTSLGFDDAILIHFDDTLRYPHMVAETENGAIVRMRKVADFDLQQVGLGKTVRVFGRVRSDGTFFANLLYIYDYKGE